MINSGKHLTGTAAIEKRKKLKLNFNKEGTVREVNKKTYVDFMYLGIRVREYAGLEWSNENAAIVREQLDRIILKIKDGSFRFKEVFANSKKAAFFTDIERKLLKHKEQPDDVFIGPYCDEWYILLKATGRIQGRTLLGYMSYMNLYIKPFFGYMSFSQLNPAILEEYSIWVKQQELRGKPASNTTVNKSLIPLKMICKQAAIKFGWGASYNPFFGYKKLPERCETKKIHPFTIAEQSLIIDMLPDHWKPFVRLAFCSGLRQGEQLALKVTDVDHNFNTLNIERALTLTEHGKVTTGKTKNQYSQRTIHLLPVMTEVLEKQVAISKALNSEYLFCTPSGAQVQRDNLRGRVWAPALVKARLPYRPMIQTRHSFATTALSLGESPLWIAKTMGHSNAKMVIEVYAKYVENVNGTVDGSKLNQAYQI